MRFIPTINEELELALKKERRKKRVRFVMDILIDIMCYLALALLYTYLISKFIERGV